VLDKIEDQVFAATKLYQEKREEAVNQGKQLVVEANKQVNSLLDITEALVDKILPPDMEFEYQEISGGSDSSDEGTETDLERLEANPLPRVTAFGLGVPKRIKAVAWSKIRTMDLSSAAQIEALAYVIDLIQYAADRYIDVDGIQRAGVAVKEKVGENLEAVNVSFISPVKEIIDKHTEDIKSVGVKTVVGVVATIAQAVEVVRRQLLYRFGPTGHKLQEELASYTVAAKNAVSTMKDSDLVAYIEVVKENSLATLTKIVELLNTYAPVHITQKLPSLLSWSESINQRLSAAAEELAQKGTATPADSS